MHWQTQDRHLEQWIKAPQRTHDYAALCSASYILTVFPDCMVWRKRDSSVTRWEWHCWTEVVALLAKEVFIVDGGFRDDDSDALVHRWKADLAAIYTWRSSATRRCWKQSTRLVQRRKATANVVDVRIVLQHLGLDCVDCIAGRLVSVLVVGHADCRHRAHRRVLRHVEVSSSPEI